MCHAYQHQNLSVLESGLTSDASESNTIFISKEEKRELNCSHSIKDISEMYMLGFPGPLHVQCKTNVFQESFKNLDPAFYSHGLPF